MAMFSITLQVGLKQSKKQAQTKQETAPGQKNKTVSTNGKFPKQNSQYLNNHIELDHVVYIALKSTLHVVIQQRQTS